VTRAKDPRALFAELKARHPFSLPLAMLRVAVTTNSATGRSRLPMAIVVVFIPPVAGG